MQKAQSSLKKNAKSLPSRITQTSLRTKLFAIIFFFLFVNLPLIIDYTNQIPQHQAKAMVQTCQKEKNSDACYTQQFSKIAKEYPLNHTIGVLHELRTLEARAVGCHFIGHVVGEAEVAKDPKAWQQRIAQLPITDCSGGFLMGALEGHKKYDSSFTLNAKTIPPLCNLILNQTKTPNSDQTCVHTSGHLLLIDHRGNVEKAVKECAMLPTHFRYECASGVFMENIYRRNLLAHNISKMLVWNEQAFAEQQVLCAKYTGIQAKACWRELSHMIISLAEKKPEEISKRCNLAPEQNTKDECYLHAVGVLFLTTKKNELNLDVICKPYGTTKNRLKECKDARPIIDPL